jgi:very-short-patch-repair endonuclease
MSLNKNYELVEIAKMFCRDLRKNSTNSEKLLWNALRNRKLYEHKFYRQYPLFYDLYGEESFFIADFYCHENKLIIELDGEIHKYKLKEDSLITEILNSLGLRVIRFKNEEVENNLIDVLNIIKMNFQKSLSF